MKLKDGAITILINREYTEIELYDWGSHTTFAKIKLTPEQLSQALSRQAMVHCEIELHNIDRVGKILETGKIEFEIPEDLYRYSNGETLQELAYKNTPEGWAPDVSFNSQDSFFQKDDKRYARTYIRRWVDKSE